MTLPPRTQISPISLGPRSRPASSWMLTSTLGMGRPMEPGLRVPSSGFLVTTGLASLRP